MSLPQRLRLSISIKLSNELHAKRRDEVEQDILGRRPKPSQLKEVLNDWE